MTNNKEDIWNRTRESGINILHVFLAFLHLQVACTFET